MVCGDSLVWAGRLGVGDWGYMVFSGWSMIGVWGK